MEKYEAIVAKTDSTLGERGKKCRNFDSDVVPYMYESYAKFLLNVNKLKA